MARKKTDTPIPVEDLAWEAAMAELEGIVADIESGELTLEAAMAGHSRGRALVHRCRSVLDTAEQELEEAAAEDLCAGAGDAAGAGPDANPEDDA